MFRQTGNSDAGPSATGQLLVTPHDGTVTGVAASYETSTIYNGTTALTPKFAPIVASSSGNTTLVSGVTSKKIRVVMYLVSVSADVNVKFRSSTAGDLTGLFYFAAKSGASPGFAATGHFETAAGEDLQVNLSSAVPIGGHLQYVEV